MYLRRLELTNFRNYTRLELDLQACIHIFQGRNAQGKTNLLESIYYLATTKSPLASRDNQLVSWHTGEQVLPFASVLGRFIRNLTEHTLEMTIVPDTVAEEGQGGVRKQARYDGLVRRLFDCIGLFNAVLFLPEDVSLVAGPPADRRRYMDISLCQQSPLYCRHLSRYLRVLSQRNALLHQIRDDQASASNLIDWDEQLASEASYLLSMRLWFLRGLACELDELYPFLTDHKESLRLVLKTPVAEDGSFALEGGELDSTAPNPDSTSLTYRERFLYLLEQNRREEIARAATIIGPHRDDLRLMINGFDAAEFGSRGQQRSIVLSLKLAEAHLMQRQTLESPVILLDDIFSELDQNRSHLLLAALGKVEQVIITTTDLSVCDPRMLEQSEVWQVADGIVTPFV